MQIKPNKLAVSCQRLFIAFSLLLCMPACKHKNVPDVSHIAMTVHIERFDQDLAKLDTNNITAGLQHLDAAYPQFLPVYLEHIMNFGPYSDTAELVQLQTRMLVGNADYRVLQDTINVQYAKVDWIEKELAQAFKYIKYYIPTFNPPLHVLTFSSVISNYGAVTADSVLGIGLDMYLGKDFPVYPLLPDYPAYMTRKFSREYIVPNAVQAIVQQMYPSPDPGSKLAVQLVEAGKQQYFMELALPETPDSIRLGYTKDQTAFCFDNEKLIWQYFVQQDLLYKADWQDNMHFMNDGPSTQGMPEGAPGKIGAFVGWRIVSKYMSEHPEVKLPDLMKMDAMGIFTQAKYKPK
jgi:hypothetical protein